MISIDQPSHTATDGIELIKVQEIQVGGEIELHTARHQPSEAKLGQVLVAFLGTNEVIGLHEGANLFRDAEIKAKTQISGCMARFTIPLCADIITYS